MRVAALQHDIVWQDPAANFERLAPRIGEAAAAGAELVVLAEMFATGFTDSPDVLEPPGGPIERFLRDQAARHGVFLCGSVAVLDDPAALPVNRLLLAGPDGALEHYDKIHPFSYSGEHLRFRAGTERASWSCGGLRITPFVCYDLRFADEMWASAPHTDLYVFVANWPTARIEHWSALLVARAIENQAYVLGCNRVGSGGGLDYPGASVIVDPSGTVIASAGADETTASAEISADVVKATRERFPFLADRR